MKTKEELIERINSLKLVISEEIRHLKVLLCVKEVRENQRVFDSLELSIDKLWSIENEKNK